MKFKMTGLALGMLGLGFGLGLFVGTEIGSTPAVSPHRVLSAKETAPGSAVTAGDQPPHVGVELPAPDERRPRAPQRAHSPASGAGRGPRAEGPRRTKTEAKARLERLRELLQKEERHSPARHSRARANGLPVDVQARVDTTEPTNVGRYQPMLILEPHFTDLHQTHDLSLALLERLKRSPFPALAWTLAT